MKLHANARLSVKGRELLVDRILERDWSLAQAADAAGVSDRMAGKWVARFRAEGLQGLQGRSSISREHATSSRESAAELDAEDDTCLRLA
jgi:transposase